MIDLKQVITKFPDCLNNPEKLKAYLNNLYTEYSDRIIAGYLVSVAESGFPAEIRGAETIPFSQYRKYLDNIIVSTGLDEKNAGKATEVWMEALSVGIGRNENDNTEIPVDHIHTYHKTIVPSSCIKGGYTKYWCDCGYEYNSDFTPPSSCHFSIVEQKEPTCRSDGYVKSKCIGCGKEKTELLPKNHFFGEWHEQTHPLCESDGKTVRVCKHCKTVEEKVLPATGHNWEPVFKDGRPYRFCSQCGKEEPPTIEDNITFGLHRQSRDGSDKTPIEWLVLAKEEADRLEAEHKAEEAEKAAKKRKKIIAITTPIVCACIAFIIVLTTVIMPASNRKSAYEKYGTVLRNANVGDIISFGAYEQDNNTSNGKEDIEWRVLAKKANKILVISEYALDCQQYNTSDTDVTWKNCSLRKWMNGTFLNNAFSAAERSIIQSTNVSADNNPNYSTNPGNATTDKVFLLGFTEVRKYLASDSARQCKPTKYALVNGAYVISANGNCWWWLRSPGDDQRRATNVSSKGSVNYTGNYVFDDKICVRPALWINLDRH